MQKNTKIRLCSLLTIFILFAVTIYFILCCFNNNIIFFSNASEIINKEHVLQGKLIRIAGLVEVDSVIREEEGIMFNILDNNNIVTVVYKGIPPALFAPGYGIVAIGRINANSMFVADKLLVKHDEKYQRS